MFVYRWGFQDPIFEWNLHIVAGDPLHDGFFQDCASVPDIAQLGIVFHGTKEAIVPAILQQGLDPERRSGQAYGAGEYFSKDPGLSLTYCHGGHQMLVFFVVIPESPAEDKQFDNKSRKSSQCPPEIVVVENNAHQLPLGVLSFRLVDQDTMKR